MTTKIELRPYDVLDGPNLAFRLHDVSLQELEAAGRSAAGLPARLAHENAIGGVTSGFIDGDLAFIGFSRPVHGAMRATTFFFAAGFDWYLAFGLRKWANAEEALYPEAKGFIIHTFSKHPSVERLFKTIRLRKCGTVGRAVVFERP